MSNDTSCALSKTIELPCYFNVAPKLFFEMVSGHSVMDKSAFRSAPNDDHRMLVNDSRVAFPRWHTDAFREYQVHKAGRWVELKDLVCELPYMSLSVVLEATPK
jgi:aconitase A